MRRCLYCYLPLDQSEGNFHPACSRKIFGHPEPPVLPYTDEDLEKLAQEIIASQIALTGVQAKISLHISPGAQSGAPRRFTLVGLWGEYILKPPSQYYPSLPEVEDLTMHLAGLAKIKTVPHSLVRLESGDLAYITKRVDRSKKGKLAMEDMCQLTEHLTEHKYRGSYEQIAKAIQKYSATPGLDLVNFFELLLFSFLSGNADMHLKNFSLLEQAGLGMILSPAYDLVATALVNPADNEELALTLNGKKNKIKKRDFEEIFLASQIDKKQQENIFSKMRKAKPKWLEQIDRSFLHEALKADYKQLLADRFARLY